ncbi:MAG: hypothetical protein COB37_00090 [Kordiimonadales bacterium]|nr:MAG: hypothetical protein COB37_00090 [Kordiimonadales bacterium]
MTDTVFENATVEESALPTAADLSFEGLAPTYARTLIIEWLIFWSFFAAISIGINFIPKVEMWLFKHWWVYLPLIAVIGSVFIWAPAVTKARGFAVRERDIHYKAGIFWRKTVSLPYNRIQHVELESGPLERFFKLNTLKFFTAGGYKADMKIPALQFERASKLRTYVVKMAAVIEDTSDDSGAATADQSSINSDGDA